MTHPLYRLALIAGLLINQVALADTVVINDFAYAHPLDVNLPAAGRIKGEDRRGDNVVPGRTVGVYADAFSITDNGTSFIAYSADIYKYDVWNVATDYSVGDLYSVFGDTKATDLGRLATQFYAGVNNAATSAAFQMATWEILFETAGKPYQLNGDSFKAVGRSAASGGVSSPSAITTAQSWLDSLATAPMTVSYDMKYLQVAAGNQNLVVFTPATPFVVTSIPEPETYALMLVGLGLLGFAGRRRKKIVASHIGNVDSV